MDTPSTPELDGSPNAKLIIGVIGGSTLVLVAAMMLQHAAAVRAMRRTAEDLDVLMSRLLEAGRPGGIPPSPPAGTPDAQPTAHRVAPGPGAKVEGDDTTPQP